MKRGGRDTTAPLTLTLQRCVSFGRGGCMLSIFITLNRASQRTYMPNIFVKYCYRLLHLYFTHIHQFVWLITLLDTYAACLRAIALDIRAAGLTSGCCKSMRTTLTWPFAAAILTAKLSLTAGSAFLASRRRRSIVLFPALLAIRTATEPWSSLFHRVSFSRRMTSCSGSCCRQIFSC